jgi:phosphoglycolate phosphatase-like HAD superfamily hydrolase
MPTVVPPEKITQFRSVRPIIETGYEAILAMRLLHLEESVAALYEGYRDKTLALLNETGISVDDLKKLFGDTRDAWIADDLAGWISMNPLFPGVAAKLQTLAQQHLWYIITTKQERFVKQILKANAIGLADGQIFGLDRNMSKVAVLKGLLKSHPNATVCFVEDRLPTLLNVLNDTELASVQLIFALWGYNTAEDKALAERQACTLQTLDAFLI